MPRSRYDEPNMSDGSLLVKVEDLIYMAMGPENKNVVDFKMTQLVLHILARQLRMLEQQVEVRFRDAQRLIHEASSRTAQRLMEEKLRVEEEEEELREDNLAAAKRGGADDSAKSKGGKKKDKEAAATAQKQKSPRKGKKGGKFAKQKMQEEDSLKTESSIIIHEVERDRSKILVADKGPAVSGRPRVGSVEVVTQSQFEALENEVQKLADTVGFLPDLTLPDNDQLRSDLLQGNLTLPEAMKALQVNARIQAAERAIGRMADIMTQLAATGAIPEELIHQLQGALQELAAAQGSEAGLRSHTSSMQRPSDTSAHKSVSSSRDLASLVTRPELDEALRALKMDLMRSIQQYTNRAAITAEAAANTANTVASRMDIAIYIDGRMNEMQSLVSDYGVQLSGFDAGLATQLQGFQEQMGQIRGDLKCGLEQLASAGDSSEANAIKELTERYEDLVSDLEHVNNTHQAIFLFQANLSEELRSLVESVEMLRDQKADRDEILDALRDKAGLSRLAGLLTEEKFDVARADLEKLFEGCHEKFRKQDKAWMSAMEDLMNSAETKVGHLELVSERDSLQEQLEDVHQKLQQLEEQLGDPKAALLMRQLSRNAVCGACGVPALMQSNEEPLPPAFPCAIPAQPLHPGAATLPSAATASAPPPKPCTTSANPAADEDDDTAELVHRWCGGAHTMQVAGRQRAPPLTLTATPMRRYDGIGTDGKLYLMEEEMQPCMECNPSLYARDGAGDAAFQDIPTSEPPPDL